MHIPVPTEYYLAPKDTVIPNPESYPVLIKPNFGDGSFGITRHSVVQNKEEFDKQIQAMREQFPHTPLLIQEFLTGSEYSVGIIGNPGSFEVLPLIEIDFSALPEELPKILSYESKWLSDSPYWKKVVFKEATLPPAAKETLKTYATTLFERTECRDYARFDFRCDQNGNFKLLEVNPNPGLNWLTFEDYADEVLISKILNAAIRRYDL